MNQSDFTPDGWTVQASIGITGGPQFAIHDRHGRVIGHTVTQEHARLFASAPLMQKALVRAQGFISNGRALGFIRMPDHDVPDPAHETPLLIDAALAKAKGEE